VPVISNIYYNIIKPNYAGGLIKDNG